MNAFGDMFYDVFQIGRDVVILTTGIFQNGFDRDGVDQQIKYRLD
jgi:hypothetical protein